MRGTGGCRRLRRIAVGLLLGGVCLGLGLVAAAAGTPPASGCGNARSGGRAEEEARREARRRWALARMDEVANERLRCRQRFRERTRVEACEAEHARRYREYNEIYLEAARE